MNEERIQSNGGGCKGMQCQDFGRSPLWLTLAIGWLAWGGAMPARGQAPAEPAPTAPPPAAPGPASSREAELEERVRQLEAMVQRLSGQMERMTAPPVPAASSPRSGASAPAGAAPTAGLNPPNAPGQSDPPNPAASSRFDSPATVENKPGKVRFGPGFEIRSDDDEFIFQFHNLTQFDYRGYQQGGQRDVRDTFTFPRQWFMFSGRITRPIGYFVSIANGFDNLTILDVFTDIDIDPRLKFRVGRFKTNFTYEFFVEPIQGLAVPERSIFFNNFALNRDLGAMVYGRLFDNKLDYAVGIYDGDRNSFVDLDDSKDVAGFLNYKPFGDEQETLLENFNIGGSVYAGTQQHPPVPVTLRTIVPTTGNAIAGVPFLGFNADVREAGYRAYWDLHAAWYYKQLAIIGEWGSGFTTYARTSNLQNRTDVGAQSFYLQGSYLLTGETRSSMGIVRPLRPVTFGKGGGGWGAIEPFVRYEYLDVDRDVFAAGLADRNIWSNRVWQMWVGVDWHLTQYLKLYAGWNHSEFGDPVFFNADRRQLTSDLFAVRLQLFF
jgi:phosphate-selective porin OprO and OprP